MFWNTRRRPHGPRPTQSGRRARLLLEALETRRLLSTATPNPVITPGATLISSPSVTNPTPPAGALTPSGLARLYSINESSASANGLSVAIVDAYNDPNIQQDLATFDAQFGLPAASLTVVNQYGGTSLPATDAGWSLEIAMDVEWLHATAPGAKIVLVEANSENLNDLFQAVTTATGMANVVSMSWGSSEFQGQQAYDPLFNKPFVTFVAASGDDGGASGAEWPASSPYVVGVGGTTMTGSGETAWNASYSRFNGYSGSAGGTSGVIPQPYYQTVALGGKYASGRATPDVASVGNPNTGVAVYDSVPGDGSTGWAQVGGTSAGAPVWAGIIATADRARMMTGRKTLGSLDTLEILYGLSESSGSTTPYYSTYFHDVTSGYNYAGSATTGYDEVTGLGSPVASSLISLATTYGPTWAQILASSARASAVSSAVVTTSGTSVKAHAVVSTTTDASTSGSVAAASAQTVVTVVPGLAAVAVPQIVPAQANPSAALVPAPLLAGSALARPLQPLFQEFRASALSSSAEEAVQPAFPRRPGIFLDPVETPGIDAVAPMIAAHPMILPGPVWDAALDQFLTPQAEMLGGELSAPTVVNEPGSAPSAAAVAGLAVAIWGTWEYRSRSPRRRTRPVLERPATR